MIWECSMESMRLVSCTPSFDCHILSILENALTMKLSQVVLLNSIFCDPLINTSSFVPSFALFVRSMSSQTVISSVVFVCLKIIISANTMQHLQIKNYFKIFVLNCSLNLLHFFYDHTERNSIWIEFEWIIIFKSNDVSFSCWIELHFSVPFFFFPSHCSRFLSFFTLKEK